MFTQWKDEHTLPLTGMSGVGNMSLKCKKLQEIQETMFSAASLQEKTGKAGCKSVILFVIWVGLVGLLQKAPTVTLPS